MKKLLAFVFLVSAAFFSHAGYAIPVTYQLFGPAHEKDGITAIHGVTYKAVGACFSCSTVHIPFSQSLPFAERAWVRVCWVPRNIATTARLIQFDGGPINIVEMGRVYSNGAMTPTCPIIDVTSHFNALVSAGIDKHLGFQMADDGVNNWTLYEVQLDVVYRLP